MLFEESPEKTIGITRKVSSISQSAMEQHKAQSVQQAAVSRVVKRLHAMMYLVTCLDLDS